MKILTKSQKNATRSCAQQTPTNIMLDLFMIVFINSSSEDDGTSPDFDDSIDKPFRFVDKNP